MAGMLIGGAADVQATPDGGWLFEALRSGPWGYVVPGLLAAAAVAAAVAVGPRLAGAFKPYEGEPVRRAVPSRLAFGVVTGCAAGAVAWALRRAGAVELPAYLYLTVVGVVLAAVDLRVHRLPDAIVLPSYPILAALFGATAIVDRLAWGYWGDGTWDVGARALGAVVGAVVPLALFGLLHVIPGSGLGLGDVKLAGLLGAALGWTADGYRVVLGIVLGVLVAGLWAVSLLVTRRVRRSDAIPYGPHLLLGALLALLISPPGW
jgi:leader peptidase (prepilin peptidase)/N-methyltransferase